MTNESHRSFHNGSERTVTLENTDSARRLRYWILVAELHEGLPIVRRAKVEAAVGRQHEAPRIGDDIGGVGLTARLQQSSTPQI